MKKNIEIQTTRPKFATMIQIQSKPIAKTETFLGRITIAIPNTDNLSWDFKLIRHTNGTNKDEIIVNTENLDEITASHVQDIVSKTVLANLKIEQVNWK
jgi:hypothetical protein